MERDSQKKDDKRRTWLFLVVFFLLSAGCVVFGVLCLSLWQNAFVRRSFMLLSALYTTLVLVLYALAWYFCLRNRETLVKTLFSGLVLLLFALIVCYLLQKTGFFAVVNSSENLQAYLQKAGVWMPIFYVLLQYLQVVLLPIPSLVSTVAGVALFGAFWASVYSVLGILLGSLTAFFIGRKLGNRAVGWMIGEDALHKWQRKFKKKDNVVLTLAFILPFFPDDVLCFFAGLSSMTITYFLTVVFSARIIGIVFTCYSVNFIPFTTWWGLLIWGVLLAIVVALFILAYKKMEIIQKWIKNITKKSK